MVLQSFTAASFEWPCPEPDLELPWGVRSAPSAGLEPGLPNLGPSSRCTDLPSCCQGTLGIGSPFSLVFEILLILTLGSFGMGVGRGK